MNSATRNQQPNHAARVRQRTCVALAMLVLWQALALSFHLATERHLTLGGSATGSPAPGDAAATRALAAIDGAGDDAGAEEHPHAPHAAIDHQVAQDRLDDGWSSTPSLWVPLVELVSVPRDMVGVAAGAPPTGPPPQRPQRASIAARAPPQA